MDIMTSDAYAIAKNIKEAEKQTPVKAYINGDFEALEIPSGIKAFGCKRSKTLVGDAKVIADFLEVNQDKITESHLEWDRRNSAIPLLDTRFLNARIEPGSFIRDHVLIGDNAVIMMGAVINIGAAIGEGTMIDMGAIVGARGTIGKRVHVGAGSVIAGVLEPPSANPTTVEDEVMIGANAVILEGIRIGKGAVVAAGAIVTEDVPPGVVVAGCPARIIKDKDWKTIEKTQLLEDLRNLGTDGKGN